MPIRDAVVAVALAVVLFCAGATFASAQQTRIPPEALTATDSHSTEEKRAIADYIREWSGLLAEAATNPVVSDDKVADARNRLLEPVRKPGTSDFFKNRYSQAAAEALEPVLDSDRLIVRLNAMIVVTRFTHESAIPLAEKGLKDPSPSVRYWAAKAIANMAESRNSQGEPILPTRLKLTLLRTLNDAGRTETSSEVLLQTVKAMVLMDVPTAPVRVLELVDARIPYHLEHPFESYEAERVGLREVYQKVSPNQTPDPAQVRLMARIAQRYMNLISRNLANARENEESPISELMTADHAAMIELCDVVLNYSHDSANSQVNLPPSASQKIPFNQWNEINLIAVDRWGAVLQAAPFNYAPADLALEQQP